MSGKLYAANGYDNCPMNGDMIDVSELASVTTGAFPLKTCDAPVSAFELTFHALGMCNSDPTDFLLGNSTVDPCFYLWNTATGDNSISFGVTSSSETSFPATLPPSGDSVGHTKPHCELCNFLGPKDFDPGGNGFDNLLV